MQNVKLVRTVTPKVSIADGKTCIEDCVKELYVEFTDDAGRVVSLVFDGNADISRNDWPREDEKREVYSLRTYGGVIQDAPKKAGDLFKPVERPVTAVVDALLGSTPPDVPFTPKIAILTSGGTVQVVRVDGGDADVTIFDCNEDWGIASRKLAERFPVVVY
jgi:hypothetical protein